MKLKKAFVIGGGPLGISICSELLENNYKVVLIEASSQLLGLASTFKVQDIDVEKYYHFFYKNDHHNSLKWLEKFSKENPPIYWENISTDSINSSGRYNLDSPFSIIKLCRLKTFKVLITLLKLIFFKPNDKLDKISAEKWAIDNFGLEFSKKIWIPLLKHKFGNNSNKVSALWLATRIKRHLSTRGKGIGKSKFGYLIDTYNPYVKAFEKKLISKGGEIHYNEALKDFSISNNVIKKIITSNKEFLTNDSPVFSSLSLAILKDLFHTKNYIKGLNYFSNVGVIVCVIIANRKLSNNYWTTVSDPEIEFSAIIQQNRLYKKLSNEIIYLSRYCDVKDSLYKRNNSEIYKKWINSITNIFPHFSELDVLDYKIFKSKNAAPMPYVNSKNNLLNIRSSIRNFYFSGYELIYPEDRGVGNSIKLGIELFRNYSLKNNNSHIKTSY